MDQSLLLSDEMHLLKIRNFDKLRSKLKNIPLTDTKKHSWLRNHFSYFSR